MYPHRIQHKRSSWSDALRYTVIPSQPPSPSLQPRLPQLCARLLKSSKIYGVGANKYKFLVYVSSPLFGIFFYSLTSFSRAYSSYTYIRDIYIYPFPYTSSDVKSAHKAWKVEFPRVPIAGKKVVWYGKKIHISIIRSDKNFSRKHKVQWCN